MTAPHPVSSLADIRLDSDPVFLASFLEERVVEQVDFAWRTTPAIRSLMKDARITPGDIRSLADFQERFPILTKRRVRAMGDLAFLPEQMRSPGRLAELEPWQHPAYISRFTGGTSIRSVADFTQIVYSRSDWHGMLSATRRFLLEPGHPDLQLGHRAFLNYTWDHIAAPFFAAVLQDIVAAHYTPRPAGLSNRDALSLASTRGCDMLVTPPAAYRGKGYGLDRLLLHDTGPERWITGENVRFALTSSTPLSPRLYGLLQRRGIHYVKDVGGSTDTGTTTVNCPDDPHRFHVTQGHVYLEVLDRASRTHVAEGQEGLVVVSRIAGEVRADPLLDRLRKAAEQVRMATTEEREPPPEALVDLRRIFGANILGRHLPEVISQVEAAWSDTVRIVPNQGTQLLRFSGTMNATTYSPPGRCACGRHTAKIEGLRRTWDFDGDPADLAGPARRDPLPPDVTVAYVHGDNCSMAEE